MGTLEDLEITRKEVEALDRRVVTADVDIREFDALKAAVDAGVAELGRLDIIIANAGIGPLSLHEKDPIATFIDTLMVNLVGTRHTVQAGVQYLIDQGDGGSIVITSSALGLFGRGGNGSGGMDGYVASKHGVVGLMRTWANWLAPYNIRVNTVHPSGVNTPMIMNEAVGEFAQSSPEVANAISHLLPVPVMEPGDISDAVAWLVSDQGRYITGVTLPVDGGFSVK